MPPSDYIKRLREKVGHDLLLMPSVSGLIFDDAGRVLLVRHVEKVWVTPGGAIDPDESPRDAVIREVLEETGLHVEPTRILGVYGGPQFLITYSNGDRVGYIMIVYQCHVIEGELKPDGIETFETRYVALDELVSLDLPPWARIVLPEAFAAQE